MVGLFITHLLARNHSCSGLHNLEIICGKHGFKELVQKVYREFMMMGFISFATFLANEANQNRTNEWFLAFDFAHIVVLFVALTFVLQAIMLVLLISTRNKALLKYSITSSYDLLLAYDNLITCLDDDNFMSVWNNYWFHHGPLSIPMPKLRENIEFKIIQEFFIRTYNLPPEFNFANYTCRSLKIYVISLVEVRPLHWLLLACLVMMNYAKIRVIDPVYQQSTCWQMGYRAHEQSNNQISSVEHGVCSEYLLRYAFFCEMLLTIYLGALLMASDTYMQRLIDKVLMREAKIEQQEDVFDDDDEDNLSATVRGRRLSSSSFSVSAAQQPVIIPPHQLSGDNDCDMPSDLPIRKLTRLRVDTGDSSAEQAEHLQSTPPDAARSAMLGFTPRFESFRNSFKLPKSPRLRTATQAVKDEYSSPTIPALRARTKSVEEFTGSKAIPKSLLISRAAQSYSLEGPDGAGGGGGQHSLLRRGSNASIASSVSISSLLNAFQVLLQLAPAHAKRHGYVKCLHRIWRSEVDLQYAHASKKIDKSIQQQQASKLRTASKVEIREGANVPSSSMNRFSAKFDFSSISTLLRQDSAAVAQSQSPGNAHDDIESNTHKKEEIHSRTTRRNSTYFFEVENLDPDNQDNRIHLPHMGSTLSLTSLENIRERTTELQACCSNCVEWIGNFMSSLPLRIWMQLVTSGKDPHHASTSKSREAIRKEMSTIFFQQSPDFYYTSIEFALLLQCFMFAIWITNLVIVAADSEHPILWEFAFFIPILLNFLMLRQTLFFACMLKSVSQVDDRVIAKLCEEASDERFVTVRLRKEMRKQLHDMEADKSLWHGMVQSAFDEAMPVGRHAMGKSQFNTFLHELQVRLTHESMTRIFKVIDVDKDGMVSLAEILAIVFPSTVLKSKVEDSRLHQHDMSARRSSQVARKSLLSQTFAMVTPPDLSNSLESRESKPLMQRRASAEKRFSFLDMKKSMFSNKSSNMPETVLSSVIENEQRDDTDEDEDGDEVESGLGDDSDDDSSSGDDNDGTDTAVDSKEHTRVMDVTVDAQHRENMLPQTITVNSISHQMMHAISEGIEDSDDDSSHPAVALEYNNSNNNNNSDESNAINNTFTSADLGDALASPHSITAARPRRTSSSPDISFVDIYDTKEFHVAAEDTFTDRTFVDI